MKPRDERAAVVDALARVVIELEERVDQYALADAKESVERVARDLGIHPYDVYDRVGEIDEEAAA